MTGLAGLQSTARRIGAIAVLSSILCAGAAAWAGQGVKALDANHAFADSRTAELAGAAASGDAGRVNALARSGANLNAHGDKNVTLLQWALLNESAAGMEALLAAGADPTEPGMDNDTVVHLAAMANDPKYLELLLKHGADPNAHNSITRATPLVSALMGKRERQFHDLLAAGADPNAADRTGNTPLHQAAKVNEPQRVLDLLEAGANPRAANTVGATFQHFLFRAPDDAVTPEVRRGRDAVRDWLRMHHIPIEDVPAR
ncbi:MAG TPA: ankyrin repeat domain-containing protein [Steroidobacteraceae bacterium]